MKTSLTSLPIRLALIVVALVIAGELFLLSAPGIFRSLSTLEAIAIRLGVLFIFVFPLLYLILSSNLKDVSQRVRLAEDILESSSEAILITDADTRIEYVNPAFCSITGYKREEVIGKTPKIMKSGRHGEEFYKTMWQSLNGTGRWQGEVWDRKKDGEIFPKWLSISAIKNERDATIKYAGVFTDITSIKQTEEYLEHVMHYDSLTNLPNSVLFRDRIRQAMLMADRYGKVAGIISLDVDNFKYVNETFGHLAGDELLKEVAQRLLQSVRKNDTVSRLAGDKFAIILSELNDDRIALVMARKIIGSISVPFKFKGNDIYLNANIGMTLYPADSNTVEGLLRNADMAMYRAKEQVDNKIQFYDPKMSEKSFERLSIETNLRQAIERGELVMAYQPNVDLHTGKMTGMEALVRRQERDWIASPAHFIYIAEEAGIIIPIIKWTLQTACRQAKAWTDEGLEQLRLAVNVSATQFHEQTLLQLVKDVLAETLFDPMHLELELTERVIMKDTAASIKMMHELKDMGISLTIDDFGTGYSSLSYLKKLPVDKLKMDISFVKDITTDPNSASIAKAIIALAHTLNLRVLAEGVENEDQLAILKEHGCDEIQGYYFSVPLSADAFKKIVLKDKRLEYKR